MNKILNKLISNVEESIDKLKTNDYFNEELRISSNTLLHYYYRYNKANVLIEKKFFDQIDENIEICRRNIVGKNNSEINDYVVVQQLPLFIINLLNTNNESEIIKHDFVPLLNHKKSNIRGVTYYCLWNIKEMLNNERIINCLLKNIADTLGFVDEAVGLLAGIINDDKVLFQIAKAYKAPVSYIEQYNDRISNIRDKNLLDSCRSIHEKEEILLLRQIENIALYYD